MITLRPANERGQTLWPWLDSRHSFSFGEYHDTANMGFRDLRVINEDFIAAGGGFPMHPHRNMEILTIVLSGALQHKDSLGNGSVIRPGDVQRMSAGTGIMHSEVNASDEEPVHLLQIWILPERAGLEPGYEQAAIPDADRRHRLRPVASPDGRDGTVTIHQDVSLYLASLDAGDAVEHALQPDRHAWLQVIRGTVRLNGQAMKAGDGASVSDEKGLCIEAGEDAEVLLFDLR